MGILFSGTGIGGIAMPFAIDSMLRTPALGQRGTFFVLVREPDILYTISLTRGLLRSPPSSRLLLSTFAGHLRLSGRFLLRPPRALLLVHQTAHSSLAFVDTPPNAVDRRVLPAERSLLAAPLVQHAPRPG